MAGQVAYQISCTINGVRQKFLLDTIEGNDVRSSSNMTSHPIYQGDIIGDHMYKTQSTVQISGSYSINAGTNLMLGNTANALATFEAVFETIKNKGIICELLKISNTNNKTLFLKRSNMALTDIHFTEQINSIEFDFTFKQIITTTAATNAANYTGDIAQNVGKFDDTDAYLPSFSAYTLSNFVTAVVNYGNICKIINETLQLTNEQTQQITTKIRMFGSNGLTSLGIANDIAKLIISSLASITQSNVDRLFADGFVSKLNTASLVQLLQGKDITNQAIVAYCEYLGKIYKKVNSLSDVITCYQISSSGEQTSTLLINNIYYEFEFKRNNVSDSYYLAVKNANADNPEYEISSCLCSSAVTNFTDCTLENMLFNTSKSFVYLLKAKNTDEHDLTNYYVVVSKIPAETFNNELIAIMNGVGN